MDTGLEVRGLLDRLQQAAWELAALAIAVRGDGVADDDLLDSARLVLKELGLMSPTPNGTRPVPGLAELIAEGGSNFASETAAPLLQCAALLSGSTGWMDQSNDALLAQGRASAQGAAPFKQFVLPTLDGLAGLFAEASPMMLDVGVGVAAMAAEYCKTFPTLRVVGIDVLPGSSNWRGTSSRRQGWPTVSSSGIKTWPHSRTGICSRWPGFQPHSFPAPLWRQGRLASSPPSSPEDGSWWGMASSRTTGSRTRSTA